MVNLLVIKVLDFSTDMMKRLSNNNFNTGMKKLNSL